MGKEEWKDIEGFEGRYQISSFGRVKSVERTVCYRGTNQTNADFEIAKYCPETILKTFVSRGYELFRYGRILKAKHIQSTDW